LFIALQRVSADPKAAGAACTPHWADDLHDSADHTARLELFGTAYPRDLLDAFTTLPIP
jgi:hypothetical protein